MLVHCWHALCPRLCRSALRHSLFPAAGGSATAIDCAGNGRTGPTNFAPTTATAFQKTAVSSICATEDLSPFQGPTAVYLQHAYLLKQDSSGQVLYATYLRGSSQ